MKDMLPFLIARDTRHQPQRLAVIEALSGAQVEEMVSAEQDQSSGPRVRNGGTRAGSRR